MDTAPGLSLYPFHRCKIIHLVRHAQGIHNIEGAEKFKTSPELLDAHLSQLGWEQVDNLRTQVRASGLLERVEVVITSPLLRTLQTAAGVFGGDNHIEGSDAAPLMVENVKSDHKAISSLNCPPFIAQELCRERMGINTCDKRRSTSEYKSLFPAIDFSLIESDRDVLWTPDVRESDEELSARGMKFMQWLWTRKEKEIAVVTHSAILFQTLQELGSNCHPSVKSDICTFFSNCELRSIVLVEKDLMASATATTNYPGRIPFRPDPPSYAPNGKGDSNNFNAPGQ